MAAVTEVEDRIINVEGALTTVIQKITVVTTADVWTPGLSTVVACGTNDPAGITKSDQKSFPFLSYSSVTYEIVGAFMNLLQSSLLLQWCRWEWAGWACPLHSI